MRFACELVTGTESQNGGLSRWGDYSAMTVDPVDDCTFWYTQEYMKTTGSFNWNTRIANFKFANCGSGGAPAVSIGMKMGSRYWSIVSRCGTAKALFALDELRPSLSLT